MQEKLHDEMLKILTCLFSGDDAYVTYSNIIKSGEKTREDLELLYKKSDTDELSAPHFSQHNP